MSWIGRRKRPGCRWCPRSDSTIPGDLGAALAASGLGPLERVDVVYAVDGGEPSVGTRPSAVEMMAAKGDQYVNGELRPERLGAIGSTLNAPLLPRLRPSRRPNNDRSELL